jgi:hypothetical protein
MASSGQQAAWSSTATSVPEPSTLALYALGGLALLALLLRRTGHFGRNG